MKEQYEKPQMEVIEFTGDVVTTSTLGDATQGGMPSSRRRTCRGDS